MKFKPTLVAVAVSTLALSVQAQVFANREAETQTKFLTAVGAPQAWARGITGKGVIIGIVDNGFDVNHSDLKGKVIGLTNVGFTNTAVGVHGTQMASIAAGKLDGWGTVGVAPDAQLVLFQANSSISSSNGLAGTGINMSAVFKAMTLAEQAGASVINLSLGSNFDPTFQKTTVQVSPGIFRAPSNYGGSTLTGSKSYLYGNTMKDVAAFANATSKSVIVISSGNAGTKYAQMPAAFVTQTDVNGNLLMGGRVLIVGNVVGDGKGGWTMNTSSNQAGTLCNSFTGNVCNDKYYVKDFYVVAPGTGMWGSVPDAGRTAAGIKTGGTNGIGAVTGTSPAAAVVSGGIALLKQAWPQLSSAQMVQLVKTTATDMGAKGVDEVYGWGMVNFDKATLPQGLVTIANFKGYGTAIPLTASGIASSGSASIKASSVLQNVQGLDSYNRNYTLDMTKAMIANPVATYRSSSSYLALSPAGYHEAVVPVTENYSIKMMQSQAGNASEVTYTEQGTSYSVQFGSMTEKAGFLGNYGAGAMAFGDSSTSYLQLGAERKFGDVAVFGSYGLGATRAGSVQDSMIQLGNRISSSTWKLGVAKNNVFQNKDALSLSVVSPVSVRNGTATVTGVTGYEFTASSDGDGADARAIVSTESISLRQQVKPVDLVLGYTVIGKGYDRVNVNVAKQFNVGGIAGNSAYGVGVMAVKSF